MGNYCRTRAGSTGKFEKIQILCKFVNVFRLRLLL